MGVRHENGWNGETDWLPGGGARKDVCHDATERERQREAGCNMAKEIDDCVDDDARNGRKSSQQAGRN